MAALPYSARMPPASWPLRCRSWARVTADKAGRAMASIRPATARATPISISVIPLCRRPRIRSLLPRRRRPGGIAAVDGDVVAAALGLVGPVGVDVESFAGPDVGVLAAPRILVQILDVLGRQLLQRLRPLPRLHVVQVHPVGDRPQVQRRGFYLRLLELFEHVEADGAGDQP